jgi:hypothetical protein
MTRRFAHLLLALALLPLGGCAGYQFGNRTLYRPDIHTVHVPVFRSSSYRRNLSERLTEAVVKEIELKTPYKVVSAAQADSILSGTIASDIKRVVATTTNDDPRNIETILSVQLTWSNNRGDLLAQSGGLPLAPVLLNFTQGSEFVPEAGQSTATAHQDAIQRLAEQIVAQMEMPW